MEKLVRDAKAYRFTNDKRYIMDGWLKNTGAGNTLINLDTF